MASSEETLLPLKAGDNLVTVSFHPDGAERAAALERAWAFTLLPSRFWGCSDAQRLPQFRGARERKMLLETGAWFLATSWQAECFGSCPRALHLNSEDPGIIISS